MRKHDAFILPRSIISFTSFKIAEVNESSILLLAPFLFSQLESHRALLTTHLVQYLVLITVQAGSLY